MQDCVFPEHARRAFSWRGIENDIQRLNEVTGTNLMGIIHRADASLYVRCLLNLANREEKEKEVLTTTKSWFIRGLCPISSIEREFKALHRFENIESSIKEILLRPY